MIKCALNELQFKEKNYGELDDYIVEAAFHYFHVLNLLWSKSDKKYTKSFLLYLVNSILCCYVEFLNAAGLPLNQLEDNLNDCIESLFDSNVITKDDLVHGVINEMNSSENKNTDLSTKLGLLLVILSKEGYTWAEIRDASKI